MQNCVEITTWHFHKKRLKILQNKHQIIAYQSNLAFFEWGPVWPEKIRQMSIKVAQNDFIRKNDRFWHLYKKCLRMWEIWAN